jgi:hypothetical protein
MVQNMDPMRLACSAFALAVLVGGAAIEAHAQPVRVDRYDDADEFLPQAERRNRDSVRLFLRQQESEEVFEVITPRNVAVSVVARVPKDLKDARFAVVMLLGGTSVLSISNGRLDRSFSFQTRSRDHWWPHGAATFVVDAPSDRLDRAGIQDPFWRAGIEHRADLGAVLDAIRLRFPGPLVIHGHSQGAVSAANLASLAPAGVVAYVYSGAAHDQNGAEVLVTTEHGAPVIVVQHRDDSCVVSRTRRLSLFTDRLRATDRKILLFEGGSGAISGACGPFSPHSFFGIEKQVIDSVAAQVGSLLK